jgi:phage tail-like protein
MKVLQLSAESTPDGRVMLSWRTPPEAAFRGVRVLRRERRFPSLAELGSSAEVFHDAVTPQGSETGYVDGPLQGETVYYYTAVAYDAAGRSFPEFVSAMAYVPYRTDEYLYRSLPEIYQLFDRAPAGANLGVVPDERARGSLRRLIEIIGQPFDELRSIAGAMRDFHNIDRVDGALLPLLARWIGQPSDTTLDLDRQRNEIRYAPQYYRTTGVPANLRAAINRFVSWDARIKEFVHNVMLVTHPEQLTIWQMRREGVQWRPPRNVNLEIAFEGRVATLLTPDDRIWLMYHARRSAPAALGASATGPGHDRWHIFMKIEDRGEPQPSIRLTFGGAEHKHPSVVVRPDGTVWLFYSRYSEVNGRVVPKIGLQLLAAGRQAQPAHVIGVNAGPFALADGDQFEITIGAGTQSITRRVTVRTEHLPDLASASAADVAQLLDRELPAVDVVVDDDGRVHLRSRATGIAALLTIPASTLATSLGIAPGATTGSNATSACLVGGVQAPFALTDGAGLSVRIDNDPPRAIVFRAADFVNIAQATVAEVVTAIDRQVPGIASATGNAVRLCSPTSGSKSVVAVLLEASTAAAAFGFGAPLPAAGDAVDEDEPSASVDAVGNVWLFWASRRDGSWNIWYNRYAGTAWDAAKPLTNSALPDHEPYALLDPAGGGRMWVFWTRKKANGLRNVFSRTTTNLNFPTLAEANWTERENAPAPVGFENRDPAAAIAATGDIELYFASNRSDGWNIWTRLVTPTAQSAESAVTSGQVTRRSPAPLRTPGGNARLYLRANESQIYSSRIYPAAVTVDARYSGSTTVDFRNATKLSLRGNLDDLQRYTIDTRRDRSDAEKQKQAGLFARDAIGVYLTPDTEDQALVLHQSRLFVNALRRVLPIQVRAVFLIDQTNAEVVYSYGRPDIQPPITIGERMIDTILAEVIPVAADTHHDRLPGVRYFRTWIPGETKGLPDLSVAPLDLSSRLYTKQLGEGV